MDDLRGTIGYPVAGVEARIVDMQTGKEAPWDGETSGELEVCALPALRQIAVDMLTRM